VNPPRYHLRRLKPAKAFARRFSPVYRAWVIARSL